MLSAVPHITAEVCPALCFGAIFAEFQLAHIITLANTA
jgi:hypothetical protein